jgi:hypothetical protein
MSRGFFIKLVQQIYICALLILLLDPSSQKERMIRTLPRPSRLLPYRNAAACALAPARASNSSPSLLTCQRTACSRKRPPPHPACTGGGGPAAQTSGRPRRWLRCDMAWHDVGEPHRWLPAPLTPGSLPRQLRRRIRSVCRYICQYVALFSFSLISWLLPKILSPSRMRGGRCRCPGHRRHCHVAA